jgi:hypothetical protein
VSTEKRKRRRGGWFLGPEVEDIHTQLKEAYAIEMSNCITSGSIIIIIKKTRFQSED